MEPVLLSVALSQCMAKNIRRNGGLLTVLELGEQILRERERERERERDRERYSSCHVFKSS